MRVDRDWSGHGSARGLRRGWFALLTWLFTDAQSALAAEPVCQLSEPSRDRLSAVWVSPLNKKAPGHGWVDVVSAADLRRLATAEGLDLPRVLQWLGLRRSDAPPKTAWKVTVFDVEVDDLCRPLAEATPGTAVAGVTVCMSLDHGVAGRYDGAGCTVDTAGELDGLQRWRVRWEDAAAQGFCVLPVDRFLSGK